MNWYRHPAARVRWNAEDELRKAERRYRADGSPGALANMVRLAVRLGRLLDLKVRDFVAGLRHDPMLIHALDRRDREIVGKAVGLAHITTRDDWFPAHADWRACPRGHVNGAPSGDGNYSVRFSYFETGITNRHRVAGSDEDGISIIGGFPDSEGNDGEYLMCEVCAATWPCPGEEHGAVVDWV